MKKNYNSPMTEVTVIMVKSNMLIGSTGLEVDENNIIQDLSGLGCAMDIDNLLKDLLE